MGVLDVFKNMGDSIGYYRMEPRVTEYPSWDRMIDSYYGDGGGWAGHGLIDHGYDGNGYVDKIMSMSPAEFYVNQPHLREVVTFLARNFAQLGLHVFKREDEHDRKRDRKSPLAKSLRMPDTNVTEYELKRDLLTDYSLYETAFWWVTYWEERGSYRIRRIPPAWVEPHFVSPWDIDYYVVSNGRTTVQIPAEQMLVFPGYNPTQPGGSSPTILSLKQVLVEHLNALNYRNQVWDKGGRASAIITRPVDAGRWNPEAKARWKQDWKTYVGNGMNAGGTPIFEDGMDMKNIDFSAREQEYIEGTKLSKAEVASAFHVNPTMVGILDNASYSNVKEFRRMLYGDTLGPILAQMEDRINTMLLPMMGMDNEVMYAEFNIDEKMQGNFEEQAAALQTAIGASWMTRNEGRALQNLPRVPGGDELITPLNVLTGGQSSPTDSGDQNEGITDPVNPDDAF